MSEDAARIIGLYRTHAQAWVRARGQRLQERGWLDRFVGLMGPDRAVLDLGCGAGAPVAQYLLAKGCDLTGIDSSPELLDVARARLPQGRWAEADMRDLELGVQFDGIVAWDSFFHLTPEDQRALFAVFRRHAAVGAVLMFTSGTSHGVSMGTFEGAPLYHASLDPAAYRDLLRSHGFRVVQHVVEDPECGGHTVWLAQDTGNQAQT